MAAREAQGMVIARQDTSVSPNVYTTIAGVQGFQGPGGQAAVIDTTTLQSTAKEKIIGLTDEGQLTLDILFDPADATHVGLRNDRINRTLRSFRMTFTDSPASVATFSGYVLGQPITGSVDEVISASVVIEISGAITWT